MTLQDNRQWKWSEIFVLLVMLSLYFGIFNIYVGFSVKLYMIVLVIGAIFSIKTLAFDKLLFFETLMIAFFMISIFSALQFRYPAEQLRFIVVVLILLSYYFIMRGTLVRLSIKKIETMIEISGLIGISISLVYYVLGIMQVNMVFKGNGIQVLGALIDRQAPRLTGVASTDPNIFVLFVTLYFFYTFTHLNKFRNILGFILTLSAIVLTFSRGGYVGIVLGAVLLLFIGKNYGKKIKIVMGVCIIVIIAYYFQNQLPINPFEQLENRFSSIGSDGGSGRNVLWANAWHTFTQHPLLGIGINSTLSYSLDQGELLARYIHNTYLEILSELGIVGFITYFSFCIMLLYTSLKLIKHKVYFFLPVFVALFVQMFFLSVEYNEMFYLCVVLLYRYAKEYKING